MLDKFKIEQSVKLRVAVSTETAYSLAKTAASKNRSLSSLIRSILKDFITKTNVGNK